MPPHNYHLVIKGELGARYASAFEGMAVRARDGMTDISGPITDASHLQGLLERIASLGLTLHSVTPVEADNGAASLRIKPAGVGHSDPGATAKGPSTP